jgi:hypothetical protein
MAHEALLWKWLHDELKPSVAKGVLDLRRVENVCEAGTPDVEGCYEGNGFWIELKGEDRPKRAETPVRFPVRPQQVNWHRKRRRAGGSCWWYVRIGVGTELQRYLLRGEWGRRLYDGMTEKELAEASELPPEHSAADVIRVVAGKRSFTPPKYPPAAPTP